MNEGINRPWHKFYTEKNKSVFKIPNLSLYQMLEETVQKYPNSTAIIYEGETVTYQTLKDKIDRLANAWKQLGIKKSERIGLMLGNHPDYIICYYAAQMLGATVVQVNPKYTPRELLEIINDAGIQFIVASATNCYLLREVEKEVQFQFVFLSNNDSVRQNNASLSSPTYSIDKLIHDFSLLENYEEINITEDIAVIQYTGGTTGKVKGAMLTHYNLLANVVQSYSMYNERLEDGKETTLLATPLYHVYAMTAGMNLSIFSGHTLLVVPTFDVDKVLLLIKKYRPTFFPGVPTMYNAFVNHPHVHRYGLDSFKVCSSGSAPLPPDILHRFEKTSGVSILEGFGMSETSPTSHRSPINAPRKIGSVGIPVPLTDSKVVENSGNEVEVGVTGELIIKGPQVMKGYWNKPRETKEVLHNGWLYTGDLATMDRDGYFYIVGRKKEMIISGGFNIYPQEVEGVLYDHPAVKEAAVIGIPHKYSGEQVKAFVVLKEGKTITEEELLNHCYKHLTRYKVPKQFEVRKSLPRNTVGKLLKRVLIEEERNK